LANTNTAPPFEGITPLDDPFYPRIWLEKLDELRSLPHGFNRKAKGIFICNMSDLFGIGVPVEWTQGILRILRVNSQHRFYLLTKQPQNLEKFSPFPSNCWVGVSCTDCHQTNEAGFWLRNVQAGLKFISFEPLLHHIPVNFEPFLEEGVQGLGWVIIGAQTNPYLCPDTRWINDITRAAIHAEIPVFHKDNLYMIAPKMQQMPKEVQYAGG